VVLGRSQTTAAEGKGILLNPLAEIMRDTGTWCLCEFYHLVRGQSSFAWWSLTLTIDWMGYLKATAQRGLPHLTFGRVCESPRGPEPPVGGWSRHRPVSGIVLESRVHAYGLREFAVNGRLL